MKECRSRRVPGGLALALTASLGLVSSTAQAQKLAVAPDPGPAVVGVSQPIEIRPKLEGAYTNGERLLWGDWLRVKDASFLKAHFVDVNLRPGDVLILRSTSGRVVEEIKGRGPKGKGSFWALSAYGEELILEFDFAAPYDYEPFRVDQVITGDPNVLQPPTDGPESICSPGDFEDVICYQSDAGKWSNVMASVGVMTVGGDPVSALWCSGSNVSPLNYLLTNDHCIASQSECDTAEFVFKFYRTDCGTNAAPNVDWEAFRCDEVVASSPFDNNCESTLSNLDYALCSVIGDPASTYGFVNADPTPITDGEAIYIIQHPAGRPHEITHGSGPDVDADGTVLRYYTTLDTEGGSSGSPLFRESDDMLIGLHHCGGCTTPGTGNRGMLMSDIYPEIASFLCTPAVGLVASEGSAMTEIRGNGDGVFDPGEIYEFFPSVRNTACFADATGVTAEVIPSLASAPYVKMLDSSAMFGNVAGGASAASSLSVRFKIKGNAPCGSSLALDMVNIQATGTGLFNDSTDYVSMLVGSEPVETELYAGFENTLGWSVVDGGAGAGVAQTWTTTNPGARVLPLTAPYFIVDSDEHGTTNAMDEELVSPVISVEDAEGVYLQFTHDFRWYSGGQDEQCDVDIRSSATRGSWETIANYSGASASGTVELDITAYAAGQSDVQIRFHYYDALYEWWWAVDDVYVLGSNGFVCNVGAALQSSSQLTPGTGVKK